jgi:hypothetical protein
MDICKRSKKKRIILRGEKSKMVGLNRQIFASRKSFKSRAEFKFSRRCILIIYFLGRAYYSDE